MNHGDIDDEINRQILAVAEDQMRGFCEQPFLAIAEACNLSEEIVIARLRSMLSSGSILRLRQTLPSTALTRGCLIAWQLPEKQLEPAFEWLRLNDPFTGHIVIREPSDPSIPGADYRLWTTLKVPAQGGDINRHCRALAERIGAQAYACMPVVGMFSLSVGHVRRAALAPDALLPADPIMQIPPRPSLNEREWDVLLAFRRPLAEYEICPQPWRFRAQELGIPADEFYSTAKRLVQQGVLGRFAAVLNHSTKHPQLDTGAGALLMWAVPPGQEQLAGAACGRHICMTHCYWRSGAERFGGVQIMGVVHAKTREGVMERKAAIDAYLAQRGIQVLHTAAFYTQRAHIRPSEIDPMAWERWINQ